MDRLVMGVIQLDSQADKDLNLEKITQYTEELAKRGANFIAMPENITYIGNAEGKLRTAEEIPGPTSQILAALAKKHGLWIHCGSYAEKTDDLQRVKNTSIVIDPKGTIVGRYNKIHLYDVNIINGPSTCESATVMPGKSMSCFDSDFGKMGLTICYDMRFPELYRILALWGAKLIFVPANYTLFTGKDHWEPILRTRAIENQLFIVAPAQCGVKPAFQAYGRSMVIDPWGTVIAQASDGEGCFTVDIDLSRVDSIRGQLPSLPNRRPETYRWEPAS